MDAAKMKTVADSKVVPQMHNYLPGPGVGSEVSGLPKGDTSSIPKPTPAINSGTKLPFPAADLDTGIGSGDDDQFHPKSGV